MNRSKQPIFLCEVLYRNVARRCLSKVAPMELADSKLNAPRTAVLILSLYLVLGAAPGFAQATYSMTVGPPTVDANGVKYYPVKSVYQGSQQQTVRVLNPTNPVP